MKKYYKNSDSERYEWIRKQKLKIHNQQARIRYWLYFYSFLIVFFIIIPIFQVFYQFSINQSSSAKPFQVLLIVFFSFLFTFASSFIIINILIKKHEENDIKMKVDLFRSLVIRFIISMLLVNLIPYIISILLFGTIKVGIKDDQVNLNYFIIALYIHNISLLLFLNIFIYLLKRLCERIKNSNDRKYKYIYWLYFLKSVILYDPKLMIGMPVFFILSIIPGFIHPKNTDDFFRLIGFFSFLVTAFVMAIQPLVSGLVEYPSTFHKYTAHIIKDIIVPNLNDHIIIIGAGNLGGLVLKSCFFDIHPEGYGFESICFPQDKLNSKSERCLSDYNIIIDRNLEISLVSRKILIIDKNDSQFKYIFEDNIEYPFGVLAPTTNPNKSELTVVIGICGDALNSFVLNAARSDKASLIINTRPDPILSLELAKLARVGKPMKQVLSIVSFPLFDVLNIYTYDKPVYLVDTQYVEGISLSQRTLLFITKYLNSKIKFVENKKKYDDFINYVTETVPTIMIIGKGDIIYHVFHSLVSSFTDMIHFIECKNNNDYSYDSIIKLVKKIIQSKLVLLTTDEKLIKEAKQNEKSKEINPDENTYDSNLDDKLEEELIHRIKYDNPSFIELFPIINKEMDIINDKYVIKTYYPKGYISDYYVNIINKEKPELLMLASDHKFESIEMFNRISNSISIINNQKIGEQNTDNKDKEAKSIDYKPQIITYAHKDDRHFINDQIKKHFSNNLDRFEIIGFPSQLIKESRLTREYVASNQFVAMIRSLLKPEKEGDISFTLSEKPGDLAKLLIKVNKMKILSINNSVKVPSFLFSYSFEDRRYKDTFIFTGTAKLDWYEDSSDSNGICFLNCGENDREEISEMLENNLDAENPLINISKKEFFEKFDPGKYRDCPISSIFRHTEKHYDAISKKESRRLFMYSLEECPTIIEKETNNGGIQFPQYAHLKIWGVGLYPGTLAESLTNIILGTVYKERYFGKDVKVPNLNFCTNYPYPLRKYIKNKYDKNSHRVNQFSQENIYLKIWDEKYFCSLYKNEQESDEYGRSVIARKKRFEKGIIRAIKIKKGCEFEIITDKGNNKFINDDSGWLLYANELYKHINSQYDELYKLYVIEKHFVEGISFLGYNHNIIMNEKTELLEINNYYKISNGKLLIPDFQIIKKVKKPKYKNKEKINYDRYDLIHEFRTEFYDLSFLLVTDGILQSQAYELVLIRSDIIDRAKYSPNNFFKERYQNFLFFIDDL